MPLTVEREFGFAGQQPANPRSARQIHLYVAPTTAISATTVPNAAPALMTGAAARHLMVLVRLLTLFLSFPPPEGYKADQSLWTDPVLRVAPTARIYVVTFWLDMESRLGQ